MRVELARDSSLLLLGADYSSLLSATDAKAETASSFPSCLLLSVKQMYIIHIYVD